MPTTREMRPVLTAMYAGLAVTVAATVFPYADRATTGLLAEHIRAGYPAYTAERIDSAVVTYLVLSTVIGVFGVTAWLGTTWAVKAGRQWARPAGALLFALGVAVGLAALLVRDTSGAAGLPPALGWAWTAPSVAALPALVLLWKRPVGS